LGPDVTSELIESLLIRCNNDTYKDDALYLLGVFAPHLAQKASQKLGDSLFTRLGKESYFKEAGHHVLESIAPPFWWRSCASHCLLCV